MTRPDQASTLRTLRGLASGVMLATAATMVAAPVASAADVVLNNGVASTLWMIPGEGNLNGMVQFVYVSPEPPPGPGQVRPAYDHTVGFFTSRASGA